MSERDVDAVFAALADSTRRAVVRSLAEQGPATATELASQFPVTRQAIAKHLTMLAQAGLVTVERQGREVRYQLTPEPMQGAVRWMAAVGGQWDDRLASLQKFLGKKRP